MRIEKNNVLMCSLIQSKKVNMYKEVKIEFAGDKVNDAGGLLREWMHLVIHEMFDESTGIFRLCNTDDTMYRLKWDEDIDEEFSGELLILYGVILGKAIFEKIPINSYLDRTILRQLARRDAHLEFADIFGYDKELYNNWKFIKENEINEMGLDAYFVIAKEKSESSTIELVELVEDGKDTLVTDENKNMYISCWYCPLDAASIRSARRRWSAPSTSSGRDSTASSPSSSSESSSPTSWRCCSTACPTSTSRTGSSTPTTRASTAPTTRSSSGSGKSWKPSTRNSSPGCSSSALAHPELPSTASSTAPNIIESWRATVATSPSS